MRTDSSRDVAEAISEGLNCLHAIATGSGDADPEHLSGLMDALKALRSGSLSSSPSHGVDDDLLQKLQDIIDMSDIGFSDDLKILSKNYFDTVISRWKPRGP